MNKKHMQKLSEFLGIGFSLSVPSKALIKTESADSAVAVTTDDAANDYAFARNNLRKLATNAEEVISELRGHAEESEHARMYEVLNDSLRTARDLNMSLVDLHLKKDNSRTPVLPGNTRIDKAVFVGNLNELLKETEERVIENDK